MSTDSKGLNQSPGHKRTSRSPAKRTLKFADEGLVSMEDIDVVPLSSAELIKEGRDLLEKRLPGQTHRQEADRPTEEEIDTGSTVRSTSDQPVSPKSEPGRVEGPIDVPKRLVPSASTERIMDILRERGLDVTSEKNELKGLSLEVVDEEESYDSANEDEINEHSNIMSSTPAGAVRSEDYLHRLEGTRTDGMLSPDHLPFSVGSSPLHRNSPNRNRRPSLNSLTSLPEGTYLGEAQHKDRSLLSIVFQVPAGIKI